MEISYGQKLMENSWNSFKNISWDISVRDTQFRYLLKLTTLDDLEIEWPLRTPIISKYFCFRHEYLNEDIPALSLAKM